MDILVVQISTLIILFVIMLCAFIFPSWWINNYPETFENPKYQLALSLANCVSGGVFVATFFIALLPEVRDMFNEILEVMKITSNYPVTECVVFLGFTLALFVEQCALEYQEKSSSTTREHLDSHSSNDSTTAEEVNKCKKVQNENSSDSDSSNELFNRKTQNGTVSQRNSHGHSHGDVGDLLKKEHGIRFILLILSLGIHSIFEGLALGLQNNVTTLLNLFVGVAIHEFLMAFAMGVSISSLHLSFSTMCKFGVLFSAMIPFGQAIGLILGAIESTKGQIVSAIIQGIAAGTFIHVTFFEAIPAELKTPGHRLLKVLFIFIGFALLLGCTLLLNMLHPGHAH